MQSSGSIGLWFQLCKIVYKNSRKSLFVVFEIFLVEKIILNFITCLRRILPTTRLYMLSNDPHKLGERFIVNSLLCSKANKQCRSYSNCNIFRTASLASIYIFVNSVNHYVCFNSCQSLSFFGGGGGSCCIPLFHTQKVTS